MDPAQFIHPGFVTNYPSNAFREVGPRVHGAMDTDLRLNSPRSWLHHLSLASKGHKRKWSLVDGSSEQQLIGSSLSLGLGWCSSSSDSKGSSATACTTVSSCKEADEGSTMDLALDFALHLGSDKNQPSKKAVCSSAMGGAQYPSKVDLELSLSTGPSESGITNIQTDSPPNTGLDIPASVVESSAVEEGSTSCLWNSATIDVPPTYSSIDKGGFFRNPTAAALDSVSVLPDPSSSVITTPNSSLTCSSGMSKRLQAQHRGSTKTCQVEGCGKGARGASGRCISHGGGRRCQKSGCHKGAEGRTVFCKAHGGGRRCEFLGCTKSAEGRTDFCIAHGGGHRCSHDGCTRAARGKSGLCIRHGGGKRCQRENCTKSAEGLSGLCISHGGGRRCQYAGCTKGAQGSTMYCKAHGGGKRCTFVGCTKGAEGSTPFCKGHGGGKRCSFQGGGVCSKSVHGGTAFCVAHGGGKRCAVAGCTKSARGRTDYCVRHGGGKRCQFPSCGKSAQGSTDYCKAHGGGKRCSWATPGSCSSFARGKTGLCALHSGLVQDKRVHGGGVLSSIVQGSSLTGHPEKTSDGATSESMSIDHQTKYGEVTSSYGQQNVFVSTQVSIPEGRVHGGSLMAMLASGGEVMVMNAINPGKPDKAAPPSWM
ncbi:hypothetical protein MLD38_018501 [Melastoma candidum]|uniref:Uncharacterized protein n=1 Tax=Melastoma candidum TaxID=119954 RepID=A0ACB9QU26_9MYRT|nr:hypothetical protein MLD38_018501 [Melastoma candidum]